MIAVDVKTAPEAISTNFVNSERRGSSTTPPVQQRRASRSGSVGKLERSGSGGKNGSFKGRRASSHTHHRKHSIEALVAARTPSKDAIVIEDLGSPTTGPRTNFLLSLEPAKLACRAPPADSKSATKQGTGQHMGLSRFELSEMFVFYDRNANGLLDANEIDELSAHIVEAVTAFCRKKLTDSRPDLTGTALEEALAAELALVLPGSKAHIATILQRELPNDYPINRKIREDDFIARWNACARDHLFHRLLPAQSSVGKASVQTVVVSGPSAVQSPVVSSSCIVM